MGSDVYTQLDHTWYCASPQKLLARSRLYFTSKWTMILVPSPSQSRAVASRHWPALTMPQTTWEIHTLALRRTLTTQRRGTLGWTQTRPRHFRVAHCHGLPALLSLAMYQRLIPCMGVGSQLQVGSLPSSKKRSKQVCLAQLRRTRYKPTLTMRRREACICASISLEIHAQWMLPWRSMREQSAHGDRATISMSLSCLVAIYSEFGCFLRSIGRLAFSGR